MRYLVFFSVLWAISPLAYAQKRALHIDSIQRFYFLDYYADSFGYYRRIKYEVVKEKGVWKQYMLSRKIQENDDLIPVRRRRLGKKLPKPPKPPKDISKRRFIANMPVDTLQRFIALFNQTRPNEPCMLEDFGINQTWINKTAPAFYEEILQSTQQKAKYEANKDKIMAFISSEKYYYEHLIENAYFHTDDYPTSAIRIDFTDGDTLHLVTHSQQKRMPIWSVFRRVAEQHTTKNSICSPAISQWLGHQILSNNGYSNKRKLLGEKLLEDDFGLGMVYDNLIPDTALPAPVPAQHLEGTGKNGVAYSYTADSLRRWEGEWGVRFMSDYTTKMWILAPDASWAIHASVNAQDKDAAQLSRLNKTVKEHMSRFCALPFIANYKPQITDIAFEFSLSEDKKGAVASLEFSQKQNKYWRHQHIFKPTETVSYQEQEADFFVVITEKNGARSFWAWEAGKRLILWKYDENSAFAALDTAGKARKRFPTDTEHVLLKPID